MAKGSRCAGSNRRTGGFPGDSDVCEHCGGWVKIKQDGTAAAHAPRKTGPNVNSTVFNDRRAPKKPQGGEPGLTSL